MNGTGEVSAGRVAEVCFSLFCEGHVSDAEMWSAFFDLAALGRREKNEAVLGARVLEEQWQTFLKRLKESPSTS